MAETLPPAPPRICSYRDAVREALELAMARDERVIVLGEGVTDPKAIFGTTEGLLQRHGPRRVLEMPVSENGFTGMAVGAATLGLRPVIIHQRVDFSLYSLDQIINNAAKWHYMYGGRGGTVPLVIRMLVGRGWGQGAQHAQSLEALFAHIPGLKVVMPATAGDAKGLMLAAIEDPNPVIWLEHRWLHGTTGVVPEGWYTAPLSGGRVRREGRDVTVVATGHMVVESLRAALALEQAGVGVTVIDQAVLRPLDITAARAALRATGRLLTVDSGWMTGNLGGEIVARLVETDFSSFLAPPRRLGMADHPSPATRALIADYQPTPWSIAQAAGELAGLAAPRLEAVVNALRAERAHLPVDAPDSAFIGPF
ncbi:MAG: alpha-ketoacid dehydrogenase subunit beta [Magnetococcus sp. WYHC-3]